MLSPATKIDLQNAQRNLLRAVAFFEFSKGIFVLLIGLSAILLVHKDAWVIAESVLALLHISTDRHSAQVFLDFADNLTDARLWAAVQLAFTYSALRFAEAYGLWHAREWAEWFALLSGAMYLPWEAYSLLRHPHPIKWVVLLANLAIVVYMVVLRAQAGSQKAAAGGSSG